MIPDPQEWMPPSDLRLTCELCSAVVLGLDAIDEHLHTEHGYPRADRWPDGGLVLDTSALLNEEVES